MNAFQTCKDTSDIIPLYIPQQLYLKPVAKIFISLQLPSIVKTGKSISHWEIMEKLRELIAPEDFTSLKVSKSTVELVRFEADVETKTKISYVVKKLDNKTIKLKNFSELMRLRAVAAKSDFPNRHIWDGFFHESKDMDEMKPGERPDTVHLSNLPTKWFVPYHLLNEEDLLPSEKLFYKIFEKFGPIRYVDIPICDPYRNNMKDHISGIKNCLWKNKTFFEGYVQFKDYLGFTKCMDFLRDMKLVHKDDDMIESVDIKVDFDRSKHLSDASIRRREIVRDRLVKKQQEKEEKEKNVLEEKKKKEEEEKQKELNMKQQKEQRRRLREEKRKAAVLEKLKIKGADEINAKIAKEEKKLLKVQRKLESIRLLEELFKRIKDKRESEPVNVYTTDSRNADTELQSFKSASELEVFNQKQKLHTAIQGRVMLKTALQDKHLYNYSSSSEEELSQTIKPLVQDDNLSLHGRLAPAEIYEQPPLWYGYPYHVPPTLYHQSVRGHPTYNPFRGRGRSFYSKGLPRGGYFSKRSRGYNFQYRGNYQSGRNHYPPEIEEEYIKYFSKFFQNDRSRESRSERSRSRSRRSRSRSRKSRSRSRKSRTRSYSRQRSYSRNRSYSRSTSRSRSRSNSRSTYFGPRKNRSGSLSARSRRSSSHHRRTRSRTRKSRTRSKGSDTCNKSESRCSRNRTPELVSNNEPVSSKKNDTESPGAKSVDSSKFISPKRMRRERSKSWSSPTFCEK